MQTLKEYEDIFKKGYGTKGHSYCYFLLILKFRTIAQCAATTVGVGDGVFSWRGFESEITSLVSSG